VRTKQKVIGQTGRVVLSDEAIQYKLAKKRTVRYQYAKVKHGWNTWVCGPFHSRTYGACGYGTTKKRAKAALKRNLGNNYNYIGQMLFSDVDEADIIGLSPAELWHRANNIEREALKNAGARPISVYEAIGSAGM
jgi:hypothetical protein